MQIKKTFAKMDKSSNAGVEKTQEILDSVKRFKAHIKLCKENLKNWRSYV